jgi:hypothetical protein
MTLLEEKINDIETLNYYLFLSINGILKRFHGFVQGDEAIPQCMRI